MERRQAKPPAVSTVVLYIFHPPNSFLHPCLHFVFNFYSSSPLWRMSNEIIVNITHNLEDQVLKIKRQLKNVKTLGSED